MQRMTTLTPALLTMICCATSTHYARRPEPERAANIAMALLRPGMTLLDVVRVMVSARLPYQQASLDTAPECPEPSIGIVLHAGELVARVGSTRVRATGFASIQTLQAQTFRSEGFERQGQLLDAIRDRQGALLTCSQATMSFDSVVEGGCGRDTISLTFADEALASTGPAASGQCVH